MAVYPVYTDAPSGLTMALQVFAPGTQEQYDFDDGAWKSPSNVTTGQKSLSEWADAGDSDLSIYHTNLDYSNLHPDDTLKEVLFEFRDTGSGDTLSMMSSYVRNGMTLSHVTDWRTDITDLRGAGAEERTLRVKDVNGNAIAEADVWLTGDKEGENTVAGALPSDSDGLVSFQVDLGNTYYIWAQKDGVNFNNPTKWIPS